MKRAGMVNCAWGEKSKQLHNRHARTDFDTKTQETYIPSSKST